MRIPIGIVQERINKLHGDRIILVPETYAGINKRAQFIDKEYGLWTTEVKSVLRGRGNPKRYQQERRITIKEVQNRIHKIYGNTVKIVESTYIGTQNRCQFIDIKYGVFTAIVNNVLKGHSNHKNRTIENNIKKFGHPNPIFNAEVKKKAIKTANSLYVRYHWNTLEELTCQGSWEARVIDYLNSNKIDFKWQPKTFQIPNGKRYTPDLLLIKENRWIEIKGYMRKDAQEKWDWFKSEFPNSELWNQSVLEDKGIL